ncbi:MFS transporter [Kitasatospora purpeofusca]|uniref:MFS transporter n=1 Tax=Kitasatospora purpeofusca TaxID=67352 RepID=UPI002E139C9D|nr:MFS transporter [Kitasatospora purpeofusca]
MRTYRELFREREFTALFLFSAAQTAAQTVAGLALGVLVFRRTDSPLLAALAMFGPACAQLLGAATVLSAADRLPPRAALTGLGVLLALGTAVQAVPGLPPGALVPVLLALGVAGAAGGGVRYGLLHELLSRDGYLLGRSALGLASGPVQIGGFAIGGALVAALTPSGALLTAAALHLLSAGAARAGLRRRPPRAAGRPSVAATWRANARLWSSAPRRSVYLALWVPNGLIVGVEALYVPYRPDAAGLLFAVGALGMLVGDVLVGRVLPAHRRERLAVPLCGLLAAPYLGFALGPGLPVASALVAVATVGYGAGLLLQERLVALTPPELSGQALGLHGSGMLAMQGVGAAVAGAFAELTSATTAMAGTAAASLAVTALLAPGLRRDGVRREEVGREEVGRDGASRPGVSTTPCP